LAAQPRIAADTAAATEGTFNVLGTSRSNGAQRAKCETLRKKD